MGLIPVIMHSNRYWLSGNELYLWNIYIFGRFFVLMLHCHVQGKIELKFNEGNLQN